MSRAIMRRQAECNKQGRSGAWRYRYLLPQLGARICCTRGIDRIGAIGLASASASHQSGGIKVEIPLHEFMHHPGQELIADRPQDFPASPAAQPVIRTVGRHALDLDAPGRIGVANFIKYSAHGVPPRSRASLRWMSSRKSFFEILPTAVAGNFPMTSSLSGNLNRAMRFFSRNFVSATRSRLALGRSTT